MFNGFVQLPGKKNKEENFQDSFSNSAQFLRKTAWIPYRGEADEGGKNQRNGISIGEKDNGPYFSNIPQREPFISPFL